MRPALFAIFLLLAGLTCAPHAAAYERATVEGDPELPLFWNRRRVVVRIAYDTSADVGAADLRDAIGRSLATWSALGACSDLVMVDLGATTGLTTNLGGGMHDEENRIVFREEAWPPDVSAETLAITTLVYRRSTGEVLDADIDVNGVDHTWSVAIPVPMESNDVENTMTHELGHLIGFAHVADPDATMYGRSDPGDIAKRDLAPDDELAVCEVYPRGLPTPGGTGRRPDLSSGCAVSGARQSRLLWAGVGLALILVWRRSIRRARRAAHAA